MHRFVLVCPQLLYSISEKKSIRRASRSVISDARGKDRWKEMKILVINSGLSSLKYQLFDIETEKVIAKGLCDRIGVKGATGAFTFKTDSEKYQTDVDMPDHAAALKIVLDTLVSKEHGVISSVSEIEAVGHRVLHGGDKVSGSVLVTPEVKQTIRDCFPLGPLHNPANLNGIESCEKIMPGVPQVAVFDTGFHQTIPDYAYMYGIPYEYYEKYKVRRYGFHGTSHKFVSRKAAEFLGKKPEELNLIILHLGNGSSLSAVRAGKCVDTTMGLTPLEGPIMGTRSGTIDPSVVTFMLDKLVEEKLANGETVDPTKLGTELSTILNKKAGLLGISGKTSDCRYIVEGMENGDPRCTLAYKMLVYQIQKLLGSYIAVLGRVDAIVFTAGQGENGPETRESICEGLEELGIKIDLSKNDFRGQDRDITADGAKIKTLVLTTNEELEIARDTYRIVSELK